MFPTITQIVLIIVIAIIISIVPIRLSKRIGFVVQIGLIVGVMAYLFVKLSFLEAIMLFSIGSSTLAYFDIFDRQKYEKRKHLQEKLQATTYIHIPQTKEGTRLLIDLLLTVFVSAGGVIFFLFAPETYAVLKFIIVIAFIAVLTKTIERVGNFGSTAMYWLPEEEKLLILSRLQAREYPMSDLKRLENESSPDLLRLHPLFAFLSENADFTSSFQPVLKLSFPGEHLFISPDEIEKWSALFQSFSSETSVDNETKVLPIWHPSVLKRLLWKGYFAIAVKGISAYTGIIFLLIWLDAPPSSIAVFVLFWWLFNLYISDRVLIAATDTRRVTEGETYERAQRIFRQAGMSNVRLLITDSPVYNGFATGMNIGRGTVILTSATMELSTGAIEAILAHEAIHVKKRDVLVNQVARIGIFSLLAGAIYIFFDRIVLLADYPFILMSLFYLLFIFFPLYFSFVAQWTEGRADHLGALLLQDGSQQMADGLRELALAQERDAKKSLQYKQVNDEKERKTRSFLARESWFIRVIEFQVLPHPPIYWRIHSLKNYQSWRKARKHWMIARLTESLPDFMRK